MEKKESSDSLPSWHDSDDIYSFVAKEKSQENGKKDQKPQKVAEPKIQVVEEVK